jgi:DNA-binding CsgD family transcriptional regulator
LWVRGLDRAPTVAKSARRSDDVAVRAEGTTVVSDPATLLERSQDLAMLVARFGTVRSTRRGELALVRGEAGIGKTLLLRRFCEDNAKSARILWAACDALVTPRPLGPLLDIARETEGDLQARVDRGALPHDVALALLDELRSPSPTVVVIEDVHWADEATLDVVRLVARRVESVTAFVILSFRDEQVDRTHPLRVLLGEVPRPRGAAQLELANLSREAVATLAEPAGVDPDELFARTAGNPFFVAEALAAGTERVPHAVRDAVLARAARLSEPARAVLDAVAVVPQRAELWLLEALTEAAAGSLDQCLSSGMLKADGDGVAFRHELARLAIEESLAPDRRVELNRRALETLLQPPAGAPDLARLAHHAEAAGDADAVLLHAVPAGDHAASVGAHREAERQYERALRFGQGLAPQGRAELLARYADETYLTDMRAAGVVAADEAIAIQHELGNGISEGEVLVLRVRLLTCLGRMDEARVTARAAVTVLEQTPPGPELAKAYSEMAGVAMLGEDVAATLEWGRRAIALAERVGANEVLIHALNNVGMAEFTQSVDVGREKLERSLSLAREAGLATDVGRAYINLALSFAKLKQWRAVDGYITPGVDYCREHGLGAWVDSLLAIQAESDLAKGRWDEAAKMATALLDGPTQWVAALRNSSLVVLGIVRARRGDPEYWPSLDLALDLARSIGELEFIGPVAIARAEAAFLEGRCDAVAAETEDALALAIKLDARWVVAELACWRQRAGIVDDLPADAIAGPFALQLAGDHRGGAEQWRELECPYAAALALADSGDETDIRAALEQLRALGARQAAAIVTRRLRERGARDVPRGPRAHTRANPAGLTARELEVLPLLAEGLRSAEIAQRLVVSPRTVDHHVSAILRKLGAGTRGQAVAAAQRLGVIDDPASAGAAER